MAEKDMKENELRVQKIKLPLGEEDPSAEKLVGAYVIHGFVEESIMLVADLGTDPIEIYPKIYDEENEKLIPPSEETQEKLATYLSDKKIDLDHLFRTESKENDVEE